MNGCEEHLLDVASKLENRLDNRSGKEILNFIFSLYSPSYFRFSCFLSFGFDLIRELEFLMGIDQQTYGQRYPDGSVYQKIAVQRNQQ